jgi:excisionase family DNA binding protein
MLLYVILCNLTLLIKNILRGDLHFTVVLCNHVAMQENELLTVDQAAERLQFHPYTVRKMLRSRQIPGVKFGREWRIPMSAVQSFVEQQLRKPATSEPGADQEEPRKMNRAGD